MQPQGRSRGYVPLSEVQALNETVYGVAASGTLTFDTNPANNETIDVNGVTFTFKTTPGAGEIQRGANAAASLVNFVTALNALVDGDINIARYVGYTPTVLTIIYKTKGVAGNAFALANSSGDSIIKSGDTLTGGVDGL